MQNISTPSHLPGLIYGPLIWALHFLFCYVLVSVSCAYQLSGTGSGIAAATLLALALLTYDMVKNFRAWRMQRNTTTPEAEGTPAFLALTSALLSAISFVATMWVALPATVLPPCAS